MAAPLALRRSARIKAAREKKTPTTATETERTHTRQNRPFYSYVWACHGQLIPIEKRLPRHRFHRGALPDLAPDHWLIVARNSLIGSYDGDSEVPPISGKIWPRSPHSQSRMVAVATRLAVEILDGHHGLLLVP